MKHAIFSLAILAVSSSAFANEFVTFNDPPTTRTRVEVIAELKNAREQGNYVVGGTEFTAPDTRSASGKTRSEVMAELQRAKEDGSYVLAHQEYEGQYPVTQRGRNGGLRLTRNIGAANVN